MKKFTILESLRGFAAIYVAIGHWLTESKKAPGYINLFFRFGQEAVIIFFILSGLVIFYSHSKARDKSVESYFIKRFRRIYFPLICAMIVSFVFVNKSFIFKDFIGNLFMLQDFGSGKPGNIVQPFLGNLPLWSLSYEWVFYIIFPFVFPVIEYNRHTVHLVGIFCMINLIIYILYPNHIFLVLSYFLIWWTGLELGEYFFGVSGKFQHKALIGYYIIFLLILSVKCYLFYKTDKDLIIGYYPYLLVRHFGFAFICLILTIYATSVTKRFIGILRPFSHISPVSYGIYILHYPLWVQTSFAMPPYLQIPLKIVLLFGLAYIIEVVLQPKVNKLLTLNLFKAKKIEARGSL